MTSRKEAPESADVVHPSSFESFSLERNFQPNTDEKLDVKRWLGNEFFNAHGPTTVVRLDDFRIPDTSDRELAREIIMRAGLGSHVRFNQLIDMLAVALGEIDDPRSWLYGYSKS